jgi:hypothetical protein
MLWVGDSVVQFHHVLTLSVPQPWCALSLTGTIFTINWKFIHFSSRGKFPYAQEARMRVLAINNTSINPSEVSNEETLYLLFVASSMYMYVCTCACLHEWVVPTVDKGKIDYVLKRAWYSPELAKCSMEGRELLDQLTSLINSLRRVLLCRISLLSNWLALTSAREVIIVLESSRWRVNMVPCARSHETVSLPGYGCLMIFSSVPVYLIFIYWKKKPKPIQRALGKGSCAVWCTTEDNNIWAFLFCINVNNKSS